ncbi:MAG: two-component regulator propeller domain-containing protein [Vicinamibacterales bacterium]
MARARTLLLATLVLASWFVGSDTARAVDLRNVLTDYTFTSWSRKDGLVGPVWAIAQDANGFLWLGTDTALVRFDGVRFVTWEGLGGQPLPRMPIRVLQVAPSGTLWVGFGGGGGLSRIDGRTVTTYVGAEGTESMGAVTAIAFDASGTVWSSSATGLYRLVNTHWDRLGARAGLPDEGAVNVFVDREGVLWVSTSDGIYRRPTTTDGPFEKMDGRRSIRCVH